MRRDQYRYTESEVRNILPRAIEWHVWGIVPRAPLREVKGRDDPACGGDPLVRAIDVLRALTHGGASDAGLRVVFRKHGQGMRYDEIGAAEGITAGEARALYHETAQSVADWLSGGQNK